jgi:DNA-binding transcriptional MerR regulator
VNYTISQVAEMMNVSVHTLRYYDKEGLLPDVERVNGRRVFTDKDFGWLKVLNCLKNTGMPIKEIRSYINLCKQGDSTLQERYEIILRQKKSIEQQIEFLQYNLKEINYKEWYYETAIAAGTAQTKAVPFHPTKYPNNRRKSLCILKISIHPRTLKF